MQVLETQRLKLCPFTLNDATLILELLNDPAWLQFIGDRGVRTLDDARDYLTKGPLAMYQQLGFGLWRVERKQDGVPVGMCGLLKRDSLPGVDVGFAFLPQYRGQGYATEAVAATLSYGQEVLGLKRILAITATNNHSSMKLLRAVGMRLEQQTRLSGDDQDSMVFAWGEAANSTSPR